MTKKLWMTVLGFILAASPLTYADAGNDIVDTAVGAGKFNTLVAAVQAAGLVDTLKGPGPFTVFAPTDEAFAKLPPGTVETLLKPENKAKLASILTYHVVPGKVLAADVVKLTKAKTVQGSEALIAVKDGKVFVDKATVVATDIQCSNGVIHIIDRVILPPEPKNETQGHSQPGRLMSPHQMIVGAIFEGSNLYNSGHHAACAQKYMTTMETLVTHHHGAMHCQVVQRLRQAMATAKHQSSADMRAWTLRHGLDTALHSLVSTN